MKQLSIAGAVLAALALSACGSSQSRGTVAYAYQPVRVHYVERVTYGNGAPWAGTHPALVGDQAQFVVSQRKEMDRIVARVRREVAAGTLSPAAGATITREQGYVNKLLINYSQDGTLTANERNHVATSVAQMRSIETDPSYRATAIGGGPRTR